MRIRRGALAVVATVALVALSGQASGQMTVTPGAFCSNQGDTGVTVTGLAMVCTTTSTDDRLRWRQAGQPTTTTVVVEETTTTTIASTASPAEGLDIVPGPPVEFEEPLARTG